MEAKLIPLSDFVLKRSLRQNETPQDNERFMTAFHKKVVAYANFLKQTLILGMFVPCDENANILKKPNEDDSKYYPIANNGYFDIIMFNDDVELYEEAKEKVLFEGDFKITRNKDNFFIVEDSNGVYLRTLKNNTLNTIESLFKLSVILTLTPSALKQIGVKE